MNLYVGIDLGLSGAIAILRDREPAKNEDILDMPTFAVKTAKKNRHDYDIPTICQMIRSWSMDSEPVRIHACFEKVNAFPGQGVTSMFSFGRGLGIWQGILSALQIPFTEVTPQAWKKAMMGGTPKDKGTAIIIAKRLFPGLNFIHQCDHNRADAVLIAEYIRRTLGQ